MDQIKLVKPRKKVNPEEVLEDAFEILNTNQKNIRWKVESGRTLQKDDITALLGTIKALATMKDLQLKSLELEKRLQEIEQNAVKDLDDKDVQEKILQIADKIRKEREVEK